MRRVIIESPFAGTTPQEIAANIDYARKCCADAWLNDEDPFASHLFYPQFLDDTKPEERKAGIERGYAHWAAAGAIVFYTDRGWSNGMKDALVRAHSDGCAIEIRKLPNYAPDQHVSNK